MNFPPIEIVVEKDGISDQSISGLVKSFGLCRHPRQSFFDCDQPRARMTFDKDDRGRVTGLTLTGAASMLLKAKRLP
jgi:hypothetical protein